MDSRNLEGRLEVVEVKRDRIQRRVDELQEERDRMVVEVVILRAQMAVGGGLRELRWLRGEVENMWEREGFYRDRYHAAMLTYQIELYRHLTQSGTTETNIGM